MSNTIIHGLSIFYEKDGLYKIRATIRSGNVHNGQILSYTTPGGAHYCLTVKELRDGPGRHMTLIVEGDSEAIGNYKGGYYLSD